MIAAIEKLKVADFVFMYVAKDGSTKTRDRITIPLKTDKKTSLKGLKLTIHRATGSKIFMVNYKFQTKSKYLKSLVNSVLVFLVLSKLKSCYSLLSKTILMRVDIG